MAERVIRNGLRGRENATGSSRASSSSRERLSSNDKLNEQHSKIPNPNFRVPNVLLRASQARQNKVRAISDKRGPLDGSNGIDNNGQVELTSHPPTSNSKPTVDAPSPKTEARRPRKTWQADESSKAPPSSIRTYETLDPGSASPGSARKSSGAKTPTTGNSPAQQRRPSKKTVLPTGSPEKSQTGGTLAEIDRIKAAREKRRAEAERIREARAGKDAAEVAIEDYLGQIGRFREPWSRWVEKWKGKNEFSTSDAPIQVCVRKRPVSKAESKNRGFDIVTTTTACLPNAAVFVHEPKIGLDQSRAISSHVFHFDKVYDEDCGNDRIYETTLEPVLSRLIDGKNVSLFCYGATGSGKTHTIFGPEGGKKEAENLKDTGLYQFACKKVFDDIQGTNNRVFVTFIEIYSGKIFDLLHSRKQVTMLEQGGNFYFQGLREYEVDSFEGCLQIMQKGMATRTTGSTDSNMTSSRSHAIFRLELRKPLVSKGTSEPTFPLLSLIDLAGSERGVDNPNASTATRREGASINQSLLALKECIRALHVGSNYVPYRSSKLTCVLRDCFREGTCIMLLNIAPTNVTVEQTLSCLHYANRVKEYSHAEVGIGPTGQPATAEEMIEQLAALSPSSAGPRELSDDDSPALRGFAEEMGFDPELEIHSDAGSQVSLGDEDGEISTPTPTSSLSRSTTPHGSQTLNRTPRSTSKSALPASVPSGLDDDWPSNSDAEQGLMEFHISTLNTILDLSKEEEILVDDCIAGTIDFDIYATALDVLVDEKIRKLCRLKSMLHSARQKQMKGVK